MSESTQLLVAPHEPTIVITRAFHAPRQRVFAAWTQPEHVTRWWGPQGFSMLICEIDLRPGGRWRYVLRAPDGHEFAFSGVYREIVPPERLIYTDGYEGLPGHEAIVTLVFDERDGTTTIVSTSRYQSIEDRDAHIASGMQQGMTETLDRLARHLADA